MIDLKHLLTIIKMGSSCIKSIESSKTKKKSQKATQSKLTLGHKDSVLLLESSGFIGKREGSITDHYNFSNKLGSGAYGSVRVASHKGSNLPRAIKTIQKKSISDDMRDQSKFFKEIDILRKTDHPNIVKLYEFYEDEENYHLVLEYLTGGELFDYILKSKNISEAIAANFMKQILSGVAYCHKNNIVHRDLKPENLLLDKPGPDGTLKIIDFGTSTIFTNKSALKHRCGTCYYIAPEVVNKKYNEKCDV